jgi:hypothetical protein
MFINKAGKTLLIHKHEEGFQHQYILFCFVNMLLYIIDVRILGLGLGLGF